MSEPLERPATPIGGCGACFGLRCGLRKSNIDVGLVHRPELALVGPGRVLGPHLQDDLQRLARHVAVLAGHAVDVEHRPVARQARCRDAEIQPALGEVIEHRDAVGEFGRVVIGQQEAAGAETDVLGLQKRLREQQIGRGMRFPGRGVVLADPGFLIAELIEPAQHLQVPVVTLLQPALRRMGRHREISDLHGVSSRCSFFKTRLSRASESIARRACGRDMTNRAGRGSRGRATRASLLPLWEKVARERSGGG